MNLEADTPGRWDERFTRTARLTRSEQFKRVFAEPERTGRTGFIVLYRSNGSHGARLGLAISKKCARRAVDRNRLKRLVRESFRARRHELPSHDIVVLCSRGAVTLSNAQLFAVLDRAWTTLGKPPCADS